MRHVLAPGADVLARVAAPSSLLVFGFDGTLAPIVWDYHAAALPSTTRRLLARLCSIYRCAIVSGRESEDVRSRLGGIPVHHVIGNHGAEVAVTQSWSAPIVAALGPRLLELVGVELEDKHRGLAVHYRKAPHPIAAADAIQRAIETLGRSVRTVPGKLVFDVLPAEAPSRGDAVRDLQRQEAATAVLYVGDDLADEEAFAVDEPWLVGVRVGPSSRSRAPYFLSDQREVDRMLDALLARHIRAR